MRRSFGLFCVLLGCSEAPRGTDLADGGAFPWPDASVRDAGGPVVSPSCDPVCRPPSTCRCDENACLCRAPDGCAENDPARACPEGARCVEARVALGRAKRCSDGRAGAACSRDSEDVCQTALGCVCLTRFGITECTCRETSAYDLCDPQNQRTCPLGEACVAEAVSGGVQFVCSDHSVGAPCDPDEALCRTKLGCTCPVVAGRTHCVCSAAGGEGDACDPRVAQSCRPGFGCWPEVRAGAISTRCRATQIEAEGACDPRDPTSCPPGWLCRIRIRSGAPECVAP